MGPTWVLSAPDEPHVGPMNIAIRVIFVVVRYEPIYTYPPVTPFTNMVLLLAWICNHMPRKVWDGITYLFSKLNGWISNFIPHFIWCIYLSMVRLKLSDVSKGGSGVGTTKAISSFPVSSHFFNIVKTHVSYWISHSYLTCVATAYLRYPLNMNVM